MKNITFVIFLFILSLNASAYSVRGVVSGDSKKPVAFASVVILTTDSAFVSGTISDEDGRFLISDTESGSYILKASAIGYVHFYKEIIVDDDNSDFAVVLTEDANILSEIVVTGNRRLIEGTSKGIIANVGGSSLSKLSTSREILLRMPGIILDKDNIAVLGKGEPVVFVNNRRLNSLTELSILQPENISTIELIMNPGAEYDSQGRSVIVIKTKQTLKGFSVLASVNWMQRKYAGINSNLDISYTKDNLTFYAGYNNQYTKRYSEEYRNNSINYASKIQEYNSRSTYIYSRKLDQLTLGTDWNINKKHTLGSQYQGSFRNGESTMESNKDLYLNALLKEIGGSKNQLNDKSGQNLIYIYHSGKWSKKYITNMNFQYLRNTYKRYQDVFEEVNTIKDTINTLNNNAYNLYAVQLNNDIVSSNNNKFKIGLEYNYISTANSLSSQQSARNSESYKNHETRWAGFLNYNTKLKNIDIGMGVRYEFERLVSDSMSIKIMDRNTNKVYADLTLSTSIKDWSFTLMGNARTRRPTFTELNGNFMYIDEYTVQKGNPLLKNVSIYELALQVIYKKFYGYLEYSQQRNAIGQSVEQDIGKDDYIYTSYLSQNFHKAQNLSFALNYNNKIGFWNPNYTFLINQPFFKNEYMGSLKNYSSTAFKVRLFNDFNLFKNYLFSTNIYYDSPDHWRLTYKTTSTFVAMEFALRASYLDDKLRIGIETFDPFNMAKESKFTRSIYYSTLNGKDINKMSYVGLTITYKFNNYKNSYKRINSSDINRF